MSKIDNYIKKNPKLIPVVVGFPKTQQKTVILGERKKVSLGLGKNLISGIGGKVGDDPRWSDESLDQALAREFQEEISVEITDFKRVGKIKFLFPAKPKWNQLAYVYLITGWKGSPSETESILPLEFSPDDLPHKRMWDDNRYWVKDVLTGKIVSGTFLYGDSCKKVIDRKLSSMYPKHK